MTAFSMKNGCNAHGYRWLLNDFNRSVSDYLPIWNLIKNDFLQVEERLNTINRLKDKYGSTIEEILLYKENREEELQRLIDADATGIS